jgi:hypothetical protein
MTRNSTYGVPYILVVNQSQRSAARGLNIQVVHDTKCKVTKTDNYSKRYLATFEDIRSTRRNDKDRLVVQAVFGT